MTLTLSLGDLSLSRGGRRLFSGLHLRLEAGQACALTGPNGSGKTSLLRAVAGLGEVDSGQIEFGGTDPGTARASGLHLLGHLDAHWRAQVLDIMAGHLAGGGLILAAVHDPLPVATVALEIAP